MDPSTRGIAAHPGAHTTHGGPGTAKQHEVRAPPIVRGMPFAHVSVVAAQNSVDWVGNVLVPIVAILVSSGIAIALAANERRAAERERLRGPVAIVIRGLTDLSRAAGHDDGDAINTGYARFTEDVNALSPHLRARDIPVAQFCSIVMHKAIHTQSPAVIDRTALWLATCLDLWVRGTVRAADFRKNMPADLGEAWSDYVELSDWVTVLEGVLPEKPKPGEA